MKQKLKILLMCGCLCCIIFVLVRIPNGHHDLETGIILEDVSPAERLFHNTKDLKSIYTRMHFGPIYVLGAAAGNSTDEEEWDIVKIYGIIDLNEYEFEPVKCCLMYNSSEAKKPLIMKKDPIHVKQFYAPADLRAHHFTCPNMGEPRGRIPIGVGLTIASVSCKESNVAYIAPYVPLKEADVKLAIGTKLAFGNISAEMIIEWMETYKFLGVDKVVTYYVKDVNQKALKVLNHYAASEILDLYEHEPAASDIVPRKFHPPNRQKWNDNHMLVFDSFERMSGYTYFGIIDHDEFLIPSSNRSLKQMLADLYKANPIAAGFTFQTIYYYLSWAPTGTLHDLILGKYIKKAWFPKLDNEKNIYKPKYIAYGGVHTHNMTPITDFEMVIAPRQEGYIRHFRECRKIDKRNCLNRYHQSVDTSMAEWSLQIKDNVHRARKEIFGSVKPVS